MCACVGGFATAPPIRHSPEGPSRIRFLYIYIHIYGCMCVYVYILYTSYIADAVGYPIPNVPLCTPHYLLSQTPIPSPSPPPSANVDKAQPEVAALPLVQGGGSVTNPPTSPIAVSSLSSAVLYRCCRQRPTSPPPFHQNSTLPSCVSKKP